MTRTDIATYPNSPTSGGGSVNGQAFSNVATL